MYDFIQKHRRAIQVVLFLFLIPPFVFFGVDRMDRPGGTETVASIGDFRITQPVPEETFWGTSNSVVVGWGTGTPLQPDMRVRLLVDGEVQSETQDNMVALTLDRGAHVVQAELLDGRGRRLVSTQPVTFFLHQGSENFNRPRPQPKGGP